MTNNSFTWIFNEEFDAFMHPFWKQFGRTSPIHNYISGVCITLLCFVGTSSNLLVIVVFLSTKSFRKPSNMLIINGAVSDMCFSTVNGFPLKTLSCFSGYWIWGPLVCHLYGFSGGFFGFNSLTTMVMIAIDRYLVIVNPYPSINVQNTKRVSLMIAFAWIWAFMWSVLPFFGVGSYIPEGYQTSCTFNYLSDDFNNYLFNAGLYVFGFLIPVVVICYSYTQIFLALRKHELLMSTVVRSSYVKPASRWRSADVKAAKVSLVTVLLYISAWSPYGLLAFFALIGYRSLLTPFVAELAVFFAKSSGVHDPIVYAVSNPKFRKQVIKLLPQIGFCFRTLKRISSNRRSRSSELSSIKMTSARRT